MLGGWATGAVAAAAQKQHCQSNPRATRSTQDRAQNVGWVGVHRLVHVHDHAGPRTGQANAPRRLLRWEKFRNPAHPTIRR